MSSKTVVALYDHLDDAQEVVHDLVEEGVPRADISLIVRDPDETYASQLETSDTADDDTAEAAAAGAIGGAAVGGTAGVLLGLGALAIPGLGPVVAAGPLAAGLVGAGLGAATGGLLGALIEWGIPESEAEYYAEGLRRGGTLVAVKTTRDVDDLIDIMEEYDPVDIEQRADYWRESGWSGYDPDAQPYTLEQIELERESYPEYNSGYYDVEDFETYEPTFRRHYETNFATTGYPYNQIAPAYRYGYDLAIDGRYRGRGWEEIQEQVQYDWTERGDQTSMAWNDIKDAVRHGWEEVTSFFEDDEEDYAYDADYDTGVNSTSRDHHLKTDDDFATYEPAFRRHYETNLAATGHPYTRYAPAYRFGHLLSDDARYQDGGWEDVEPLARERWERDHPDDGRWTDVRDAVRHSWSQARLRR